MFKSIKTVKNPDQGYLKSDSKNEHLDNIFYKILMMKNTFLLMTMIIIIN